ncbi:SpaA isopeptide-forming pilin-related protein [Salibacterium aidingense]|uniref:SpaA isopeptide-forming pilin-related protein n=1 Tax=Salibacterium aidingense TaxID=384933 RepID=UPI003BE62228
MGRKLAIVAITFILLFQMTGSGMGITPTAFASEGDKNHEEAVAAESGTDGSSTDDEQSSTEEQASDQQNDTEKEKAEEPQDNTEEGTDDNQQSSTGESAEDVEQTNENQQNDTDEGPDDEQSGQDEQETEQQPELIEPQPVQVQNMEITDNILTDARILNGKGEEVGSINADSEVELVYGWELPDGHGYTEGAQYSFSLPEEFNVYDPIDRQPIIFNGETIGHFSVTSGGEATVEFTDFIEQFSNINGDLRVWTEMNKETVVEENKTITVTPIQGGETVSIPVNFEAGSSAVEKQGMPDSDYNAQTAEWTVDFNKTMQTIEGAVLSDPIQEGQQLTEDSIVLYHLNTKLNGEVELGSPVDSSEYSIGATTEGGDFTIDFGGDIHSAYRAVFETQLVDEDKSDFENTATLMENGSSAGDATASIAVERGTPLEKNAVGYDDVNQTITWEIQYNYNEKSIGQAEALLIDKFTDTHAVLEDSFEVTEMTMDENGNASEAGTVTNYNVELDSDESGFKLQFNEGVDNAYKIVYETKAKDRVFDGGTIRNDVTADGKAAWAQRNFRQVILHKSNRNPDYQEKTVWWDITLNHDEYEMDEVVIEDVFTNEGLSLKPDTVEITSMDEADYTVEDNGDGFTITFHKTINTEHSVSFQTVFDYEERTDHSLNYLENQATLKWENGSGSAQEKMVSSRFTPDEYTQSNGFKGGSYNAVTKEITWEIGVNYNLEELTDVRVEDEITGSQQLLEDSIIIHEMELTGGANGAEEKAELPEDDYELTINRNGDGNPQSFDIEFNDPVTEPYKVTYKTGLDNLDLVQDQYDNTAVVYDGGTQEFALFAEVSIPHGGSYSDKSGVQDGKIINWQVDINFAQSEVANAAVVDTPSDNQMLLEDSFHVYKTEVNEDGSVAKGEEMAEESYTLVFQEEPAQFELQFNQEINEPYILEYQSFIQAAVGDEINNDISFNGENIDEETWTSESAVTVERTQGMGSGSGELSRLTIDKVDAVDATILPGAVFTLTDASSGTVISEKETDENGQAVFEGLMNGDYILEEEQAPEDYQLNEETIAIEIAGDAVEEISNRLIEGGAELTKIDQSTGVPLEGAVYELQDRDGNVEQSGLVTNEDGNLRVEDLRPGDYQFVETQAPENYQLDPTPVTFTIERSASEDETAQVKVEAENKMIPGSVALTKVDEEDSTITLEGAEFTLETASGETVQEELITDENGSFTVEELQPGDYVFVETKAPEYYQVNETPVPFTIEKSAAETDAEQVTVQVENKLILGTVELTKVDQDDPGTTLEGAVYKLQDGEGNLVQEDLVTGEDGKLVIDALYPGDYQLVEVDAPEHYQMPENPEAIPFTIPKGQEEIQTLTDNNELIPGSVALTKVDEEDPEQTLEGAVFELQNEDGNVLEEGLTTDGEGRIVISDLRPGSYQFVETEAPDGYRTNTSPVPFDIERSQKEAVTITVENDDLPSSGSSRSTPDKGSVLLTKTTAEDSREVLEGAVFDLEESDGDVVEEDLTTNKDGEIKVTDLEPGDYQFVETEAPDGYLLEEEPIGFEVEEGEETIVTVDNDPIAGTVTLTKIDSVDQEERLEGAVFDLEESDGAVVEENLRTGKNGTIRVTELEAGAYQFVETMAPEGYQLNKEPIGFEIEASQEEMASLTVENDRIQGSVLLTKRSTDSRGHPLSGAEFDLEHGDGETIKKDLTTDTNGEISVAKLDVGEYQFVETKAPDGYELDEEPIPFAIDEDQEETVELTAENKVKPGSVQLTKTAADETDQVLGGAVFDLVNKAGAVVKEGMSTSENGTITITDLEPGSYQFIEIKAPDGYQLSNEPAVFHIEAGQTGMVEVTFENKKKSGENTPSPTPEGTVALTKVDETDADQLLEGAVFTLEKEDGTTIKENLRTNSSGKIFVNQLDPGTYRFIETKAPEGYQLDEEPVSFEIESAQTEVEEVTVENTAIPGDRPSNSDDNDAASDGREEEDGHRGEQLPDTSTAMYNYGLAGLIALMAGLYVRRRREE